MENVEPNVISDELIRECVQVDGSEEKRKSIPLQQVECLMFSFKHILRIDNLHGLGRLVKLQLDNNLLTKIENLDHLVNLQWLDLSFNQITKIEGLDKLTQLTDISLFSNRIVNLNNMDTLVNLSSVSFGNNAIKLLDNVTYLRRFQNLRLVNLCGNPICKDPEYSSYVLSHIKRLKYFDYRLVDATAVQAAKEQYQDEMMDMHERELEQEEEGKAQAEIQAHKKKMEDANLIGIDTMYDDLINEDPEMVKLKNVSGLTDDLWKLKEKTEEHAGPFIDTILSLNERKRAELKDFQTAVAQATLDKDTEGQQLIIAFYRTKKKALEEAAAGLLPAGGAPARAQELYKENLALKEKLMELEVETVDVLSEMLTEFDTNFTELVDASKVEYSNFFGAVREAENAYFEATTQHALTLLEQFSQGQMENANLSDEAARLLQDKDILLNSVQASHDAHTTRIDSLEDKRVQTENARLNGLIADFKARESKRNRDRITEIWGLVDRNKAEIDEALMGEEPQD